MADTPVFASNQYVPSLHQVNLGSQEQSGVANTAPISPPGEEQALESHEVIELQSFSERKAWIEEKIKFLEALPPIEVFIGLDALRSSAENVPGLPTRLELEQWMAEHDVIEKETEIFDKGELKKLRQLTKAATQRNLSPEDTDVIELTLTTIYALDKLLHLLRDRSENLEMMSIRLSWEEKRRISWAEQRQIIADLHAFAASRARWKPSIYELASVVEDTSAPLRRGSIASLSSTNSDNIINSPAFSRSFRFRLAEMLSRDAAQFSGRITSLRHGKVVAAGKALDRLIDQSRKPVPDELLDEQDRLEEKCINEMENVSKFITNLVMQWRKADEIYVETKKDYISASNLLEEIEIAKLYHPTARQSGSFTSRADTIFKRLSIRGDPSSSSNMFPRPEHFLFPDQNTANNSLIKILSDDISSANKLSLAVNIAAKEYKNSYEIVRRAETLLQNVGRVSSSLLAVIRKFQGGIPSEDEDGSPPDLATESCLDPSRHALFIALFPSLLEDTANAVEVADQYLRTGSSTLMSLDIPGIDTQFKENAAADLQKLSSLRNQAAVLRDSSSKQLAQLRDSRKVVSNIKSKSMLLRTAKIEMVDLMERERWRQQFGNMNAPPTPESPTMELHPTQSSDLEFEERLSQIGATTEIDIFRPLEELSLELESQLHAYLAGRAANLQRSLEDGHRLLRLLGAIREQSSAMVNIRDDFHGILTQIEDAKIQLTSMIEEVQDDIKHKKHTDGQESVDVDLKYLEPIQVKVSAFVGGLSKRVSFVAQYSAPNAGRTSSLKSPSLSRDFQSSISDDTAVIPFDLGILDSIVRADSNSYALRINGSVETLLQLRGQFDVAIQARAVDSMISISTADINDITQALSSAKNMFTNVPRQVEDTLRQLQQITELLETARLQHNKFLQAISLIRESIGTMDERSKTLGGSIHDNIIRPRDNALKTVDSRSKQWEQEYVELHRAVQQAMEEELEYRDELQAGRMRQMREQEERLAAEEAARIQMELRKAEEEEQQRSLEQQLAEERQQEETRQRQMLELVEKQRAEQEATEAENRRLEEIEQQAKAARLTAAEEFRLQEEAKKACLEQERLDALQKLRSVEAQLQEERRLYAEREAAAANLANRQRYELDELAKRQAEIEYLAQENAHQATMERNGKYRVEKEAKEHEEHLMQRYSELQQLVEERERLAIIERAQQERAEQEAKGYAEILAEQHAKDLRLTQEISRQLDFERAEKERAEKEARKLAQELEEQRRAKTQVVDMHTITSNNVIPTKSNSSELHEVDAPAPISNEDEQDVFGSIISPNVSTSAISEDIARLQTQILALRKRLRSICIDEIISPPKVSTQLPTEEQFRKIQDALEAVSMDMEMLPVETDSSNINMELKALRNEVVQAQLALQHVRKLVDMFDALQLCDAALSDLLEHIDSYPNLPLLTTSSHISITSTSPEEQLTGRLVFTEDLVKNMNSTFAMVTEDDRAISEYSRINQTWAELQEMASDRVDGKKSRPPSVIRKNSSGRNSSVSADPGSSNQARASKKMDSYSQLSVSSVSSTSKGKMLAPPVPPTKPRRAVSNANETVSRPTSRSSSVSTARSVSGPVRKGLSNSSEVVPRSSGRLSSTSTIRSATNPFNTSLHGSTFASRQRTTSLSSAVSTAPPRYATTSSRFRTNSEVKRGISPAISETSSYSHSHSSLGPRPSLNVSTWSRAPRDSLSSLLPRVPTPQKKFIPPVRKKYIANPKHKLDVAVGDVVNQLDMGINIEGITETWRDQSGKYWIGNQDPKLCFCRILRSQTVMVRVGGGWSELSKFIKDHFADSFRIAPGPESPPHPGSQTERWISSATLLESRESLSPPRAPETPEPNTTFLPSFALVTPSGQSPKSIKSMSPPSLKSSPLTPLQFMRRAEPGTDHSLLRPATPSKPPLRGRVSTSNTPARNSVWRP